MAAQPSSIGAACAALDCAKPVMRDGLCAEHLTATAKQPPWSFSIINWIFAPLAKRYVLLWTAVIVSWPLGYAIALPSKSWPAVSTWIIVLGNAPFWLMVFLVLTCPIWGRKDLPWAECGRCGSKEAHIYEGRIRCVWCDDD